MSTLRKSLLQAVNSSIYNHLINVSNFYSLMFLDGGKCGPRFSELVQKRSKIQIQLSFLQAASCLNDMFRPTYRAHICAEIVTE